MRVLWGFIIFCWHYCTIIRMQEMRPTWWECILWCHLGDHIWSPLLCGSHSLLPGCHGEWLYFTMLFFQDKSVLPWPWKQQSCRSWAENSFILFFRYLVIIMKIKLIVKENTSRWKLHICIRATAFDWVTKIPQEKLRFPCLLIILLYKILLRIYVISLYLEYKYNLEWQNNANFYAINTYYLKNSTVRELMECEAEMLEEKH